MKIKSTYNFVPAPMEREVFFPDWDKQVSHDKPFYNCESGEIHFKITAVSPVFIRNGHARNTEENEFSHIMENGAKKYFIPSTSIKGLIRSLLEPWTFSRMTQIKGINDGEYGIFGLRDMANNEYSKEEIKNVKSGWLKKVNGEYFIFPCNNYRIELSEIETQYALSRGELKGLNAIEKYQKTVITPFASSISFERGKNLSNYVGIQCHFDPGGTINGHLVMFGDIVNKRYEYVFTLPTTAKLACPEELVKKMDDIEKNNKESLWKNLRGKISTGIPVFYKDEKVGVQTFIRHFGFSKLYRLNNSHYLNQLNPVSSYPTKKNTFRPDFCDLLFGNVKEPDHALKGRVFFSHAFCHRNPTILPQQERVLNEPKASFYPAYLKQDGVNGKLRNNTNYKTYHNPEATLKGYKRYPVHHTIKPNVETDNENISSRFLPLDAGSIFLGKMRYHNLKKCELGALISALSFHNNSSSFFHSIGGAKPYGFGKITIEVINIHEYEDTLKEFEHTMNLHVQRVFGNQSKWIDTSNVLEALSMAANPKDAQTDRLLKYPQIEPDNEFNEYKIEKLILEDYSERNGRFIIASLLDQGFLAEKATEEQSKMLIKAEVVNKYDLLFEAGLYEKAKAGYIRIKDLLGEEGLKEKLKQIEEKKEENDWEVASESDSVVKLDEFLKKYPQSKFKQQAEIEKVEIQKRKKEAEIEEVQKKDLVFKDYKFETIKNMLNPYLKKKGFFFSETQIARIEEAILKAWKNDQKSFMKKNNYAKIIEFPWTDIIKWIGIERTNSVYNKLVSSAN